MRSDDDTKPVQLTPMTPADMARFVNHYRTAARNAMAAGFDGVEIHGANGYLIDQFLQTAANDRTDEYGGSLANRFRFPLQVLDAVCEAVGPERVGLRMSPFSRFQGMREDDPLALFVPWARAVVEHQPRLAYVHAVEGRASGGGDCPKELLKAEDTLEPIRAILDGAGVRLVVAGGYLPDTAMEHTAKTEDLVAFGRYFICKCGSYKNIDGSMAD
jgi:NADPH2 dehydrogenase